ncbi:TVG0678044 [Thermoplasma volcanium GSS1]|uniref:TVG0678044 protein n=1 Tax=Thermoplasma volcanium (strain ATCC 51530 / DSM 4299 / JCM 9571 / NBRC 15438 / GSS1) TaxID=273116 RepID=Q97AY2_THEVO|nr:site-specific integrase [Thermoplasma volcanium]BAB59819.1 TVG0678044 [Thermoplasma volcanium GSS1]
MGTKKYEDFEKNERVNRWYLNVRARSPISADIWRRSLLRYCTINNTTPEGLLDMAQKGTLKDNFQDFTIRMIAEGRRGAYLAKVKEILHSWIRFNDIDYKIRINIPNERLNETTMDERVPTKEELSKILRMGTVRSRVSVSLMAFSGLRPEVLGNYEGTDGLTLGDIEDLDIDTLTFKNVPAKINVRNGLSKTRLKYFTFLGQEGCGYLKDYLDHRKASGEILKKESALLAPDPGNVQTAHGFLRTALIAREIRKAIRNSNLSMRPYVLRVYFATALDIAESKGSISHPWRQYIMGHKGDIEATYSTNKRLLPETIEGMRSAYLKCTKFFETEEKGIKEEDYQKMLRDSAIDTLTGAFGITLTDDQKEELRNLDTAEYQKRLGEIFKDRKADLLNNGNSQKVIPFKDVEKYIEQGWEYVRDFPGNKAIVRLPS